MDAATRVTSSMNPLLCPTEYAVPGTSPECIAPTLHTTDTTASVPSIQYSEPVNPSTSPLCPMMVRSSGYSTRNRFYSLYCGIFISSPPLSADWWATMPATVMFNACAMSTHGLRFRRMASTNSLMR